MNLDQVVESITASRADYDLKPFFYTPLPDVDAVGYRHAVLRDLEKDAVFEAVRAFAQQMRSMREHLAQADKLHYRYQKERWFLDAVGIYCQAVGALADELPYQRQPRQGRQVPGPSRLQPGGRADLREIPAGSRAGLPGQAP